MSKQNTTLKTFAKGALLVSAASMLALGSMPASAKSNPRVEAVKACALKANAEFGKGKLVDAKTQRKRKGYVVSMTKLNPEGEKLADITCTIKKGEVADYAKSDVQSVAIARN